MISRSILRKIHHSPARVFSGQVRGFSLIEGAVVTALTTVVFGMVLAAFVQTSRASQDVIVSQQMRQEALLIGQTVEKVLRFRVDPDQIAQAFPDDGKGGAGPTPAAGGVPPATAARTSTATIPKSLEDTLTTALAATPSPTPPPVRTPTAAELTSVPATMKPLFLTTGTASQIRPKPVRGERYAPEELAVYSLSGGGDAGRIVALIRNIRTLPGGPQHAALERMAAEGTARTPAPMVEPLGRSSDRFQSSVSFRYASEYDGLNARWKAEAGNEVPRLVEYTVRVWPLKPGTDFAGARNSAGHPTGFQYTGAVRVR